MAVRTIGGIAVALNGRTADFQRKFATAEKTLLRFSNRAEMLGKKMAALGRTMTMSVTLPLLGIAAAGVKAFAGFDKAMVESTAIMGNLSDVMRKKLEDTAKQMSLKTTFAAKELAESYYFLASAGMDAVGSLKALEPVEKFAQAGAFNLSTATSLLAGSQSALGMKVSDSVKNMKNMLKVSDTLTMATRLADATTEQFAVALTRSGAGMKAYGVSLETGVAVLAALAEKQLKAEHGGEVFSRMLRLMIPAAIKNAQAYKELGVAVFDTQGNLRNFGDIIRDIETAFVGMTTKAKSAALEALGFRARVQGAILPLIGMSGRIREFEARLKKAGGTTKDVANKQLKSFSAQMKILWNRIVLAGTGIGKVLVPTIRKLAKRIESVVNWFNRLSFQQKENIIKWAAIVAAIGPALIIIGKMSIGIAALVKTFTMLTGVFNVLILKTPAVVASLRSILAASISLKAGLIGVALGLGYFTGRLLNWLSDGSLEEWATNLWKFLGVTERKLTELEKRNERILKKIQAARAVSTKKENETLKSLEKRLKSLDEEWFKRFARSRKIIASYKEEGRSVKGLVSILNSQEIAYVKQRRELERLIKMQEPKLVGKPTVLEPTKATNVLLTMEENLQAKILKMVQEKQKTYGDSIRLSALLVKMQERLERDLQEEYRFTKKQLVRKKMELEEVLKLQKALTLSTQEEIKPKPFAMGGGRQHAAAVEKGTVEAHSVELRQQQTMNKVERNTKDTTKGVDKLLEATREIVRAIQPSVEGDVVEIPA